MQTSAITASPHEVQGVLLICSDKTQAKLSVQNMSCTCKAGQGGKCKYVSAVLLYCTRCIYIYRPIQTHGTDQGLLIFDIILI